MRKSVIWKMPAFLLVLGVIMAPSNPASAASVYWSYDNATNLDVYSSWTYYTTQHTINYSPYGIYLYKEDGPSLQAQWWNCGIGSVNGNIYSVSNADPSDVYLKPSGTGAASLTWCFAVRNTSGDYDTITGFLDWDGYS